MPKCEFSEEEYEFKLIKELCLFYGWDFNFYKPSRIKEKKLGFDFAISTYYSKLFNSNDIWLSDISNVLRLNFSLPLRIVSSFIQTKVPFYISQKPSSNSVQWNNWNSPFYRIDISNRTQLKNLSKLEKGLKGDALIRYVAPCFNTYDEFDKYFFSNMLCQKAHFQSPSKLLTKQIHKAYTYQTPLRKGIAFSEPNEIPYVNFFEELLEFIQQEGTSNIFKHIDNLYEGFGKGEKLINIEIDKYNQLARKILGEFYEFRIPYLENVIVGANFAKGLQIRDICRQLNLEWIVF